MWSQLAQVGLGAIHLTNAAKVERYYFDSHLFDGSTVRSEILRGLEARLRRAPAPLLESLRVGRLPRGPF